LNITKNKKVQFFRGTLGIVGQVC